MESNRAYSLVFKDKLDKIKQMPSGNAKDRAKREVEEMIFSYRAALDLGYPKSCLDRIVAAENINQVSQIMKTYRMKGA